ncbi:tyrosine-type recombinase/integrase [Arthrobacter sp. AQ5-05]|uniref:tyrosine-type recombinase/integrase n=1 Tax=Arthrobacter sp. AQ5-05 TaxID=2184581 RepID=UPI00257063C6|nr:tyrosine-type recombinase/integrase [Arthrobacter sp. AQ5-05]
MREYRYWIKRLEKLARNQDGHYSVELGAEFASMTTSPRTGRFSNQRRKSYGRLVRLLDSCVLTGSVDLSMMRRGGKSTPHAEEFIRVLADWSVEMGSRNLALNTRNAYDREARGYLLYLESQGICSLRGAGAASVLGFLESLRGHWAESSVWVAVINLRAFLKFVDRPDLQGALGLANAKRRYGIVTTLDDREERAVVRACTSGRVSDRDAAIMLLLLVTGLRACDLIALRLGDVNWRESTLRIVQQKTGNPLTLPLLPVVAEKLAAYVLSQRPHSGNEHVFLRSLGARVEFSDHASVYAVTRRAFIAAGLDRSSAGTRLLRHNAATRLLRAGTPLPTISAVLGHSSPNSTDVYLTADTEHLRACVLPLPQLLSQGAVR